MKKFLLLYQIILVILIIGLIGCSKKTNPPISVETTAPVINSITAEKTKILYGGGDPAIITCNAQGGNLKYVWQVDLGDIMPLNGDHSKISFSGAACCVGDKTINCTVSNDKGSVTKSIIITIFEVEKQPEIISVESKKTEIRPDGIDESKIDCFAIGGNLKYKWESDCGVFNRTDSSQVIYKAGSGCIGVQNVKCTVSNSLGTDSKSIQITVLNK